HRIPIDGSIQLSDVRHLTQKHPTHAVERQRNRKAKMIHLLSVRWRGKAFGRIAARAVRQIGQNNSIGVERYPIAGQVVDDGLLHLTDRSFAGGGLPPAFSGRVVEHLFNFHETAYLPESEKERNEDKNKQNSEFHSGHAAAPSRGMAKRTEQHSKFLQQRSLMMGG